MAYRPGKSHSPSGHVGSGHNPSIHQKGMHSKGSSAVEPHPKGPSVNVGDRPSPTYVCAVRVPGPRNA
jgi:hypothetical protein